ncbi:MAG: hypothetical protein HZY79_07390 [Rhodoblastus sp.]|nr:MAG: hypothetical protein HZY79_07390 [Rhodoblastus sp.]
MARPVLAQRVVALTVVARGGVALAEARLAGRLLPPVARTVEASIRPRPAFALLGALFERRAIAAVEALAPFIATVLPIGPIRPIRPRSRLAGRRGLFVGDRRRRPVLTLGTVEPIWAIWAIWAILPRLLVLRAVAALLVGRTILEAALRLEPPCGA